MKALPKDLFDYVEKVQVKYPELSKNIILDILNNTPIETKEYELAFVVQQKLGLATGYFSKAYKRKTEIKADLVKQGNYIYVKLDFEIKKLLEDGFICCKITADELDYFEHTIQFTKNTLLGFYK